MIDDSFEAWQHGPVSPELYGLLEGSFLIDLAPMQALPQKINSQDKELLERVWVTYGKATAFDLENLAKTEGSMERSQGRL